MLWVKSKEKRWVLRQLGALSLRDRWHSGHRPREVRTVRVMGITGEKIRNKGARSYRLLQAIETTPALILNIVRRF